jgi:RNA polymerase sigma factor (TIGR02999 family)
MEVDPDTSDRGFSKKAVIPSSDHNPITRLLHEVSGKPAHDSAASAALLPLVYDELRRLARARLASVPPGNTLQPTALVHEAYMRLVGDADPGWNSRAHFFGAAAQAMRDILVEQVRRKSRQKHGGDRARVSCEDVDLPDMSFEFDDATVDLMSLDVALKELEQVDERKAQIVMLRYFAGLTAAQTAEALGVTERTIERDWKFIKAWLRTRMTGSCDEGEHEQGRNQDS